MPPRSPAPQHDARDQEVVRANRELAAYFRGLRTEREARGALKIIKAFIRDRERVDPARRRPLPGAAKPAIEPTVKRKKRAVSRKRDRRPEAQAAETPTGSPAPGE